MGEWFKAHGKRDKVMLATKFGSPMEAADGPKDLSAAYMVKAVEASLKRLQTDVIDLYQSHYDDPTTPQEETMEAFDKLVKPTKTLLFSPDEVAANRKAWVDEWLSVMSK